jgi:hypothetical protein
MAMLDLLERIENCPEMFLGGSADERGEQLRNLTWVLFGYQLALREMGTTGSDFLRGFGEYLMANHKCSAARGPVAAICELAEGEDEAWRLFWDCLNGFRTKLRASD